MGEKELLNSKLKLINNWQLTNYLYVNTGTFQCNDIIGFGTFVMKTEFRPIATIIKNENDNNKRYRRILRIQKANGAQKVWDETCNSNKVEAMYSLLTSIDALCFYSKMTN